MTLPSHPHDPMLHLDDSLTQTLIDDARALAALGWLLATSGNLSVRLSPDTFLITASGRHKGALTRDDLLVCDLSGAPTHPTPHKPSAETALHCAIYARFSEAKAVYHVHDPFAALISQRDEALGQTTWQGVEMIKALGFWEQDARVSLPILPNPAHIPALAEHVIAHLGQREPEHAPGVNILRHGVYAWGESPFAARRHIEAIGYLCRYSWELGRAAR
jgi:methylthioribulose-1-phosphate dehydratase